MNQPNTIKQLKQLFLDTNATYSLDDAANLLGWTPEELAAELSSQFLTESDEWLVRQVPAFAIAVLAFADWSYEEIERALGADACLLPPLVRLKELTVRLPAHQIAALEAAASREQTTVSDILARELVELTTAEAPELPLAGPDPRHGRGTADSRRARFLRSRPPTGAHARVRTAAGLVQTDASACAPARFPMRFPQQLRKAEAAEARNGDRTSRVLSSTKENSCVNFSF